MTLLGVVVSIVLYANDHLVHGTAVMCATVLASALVEAAKRLSQRDEGVE